MIHGRIYKIYCNITGECYYGSTEQTLAQRLSVHRKDYKSWKKDEKRGYMTSFKIIERGNFTISLMEEGDFENKDFMKTQERYYIENNECVNKCVPNRTYQEWCEENKDKMVEYHKVYREENIEKIKKQEKDYREDNKEKKKQYREDNKDRMKQYQEDNKEKIKAQKGLKINCDCGGRYTHGTRTKHFITQKHLLFIQANQKN